MPNQHHTTPSTTDATPPGGRAFYTSSRDAIAYLLSGLACALLVAYVAMLVAWIFGGGAA